MKETRVLFAILLALAPVAIPLPLLADITWDADASTHTGTGGGFVSAGGGYGATNDSMMSPSAFGGGSNDFGVYSFGFSNVATGMKPTFAESELSGTVLPAGTQVTLYFDKAASDEINYIAIVADGSATLNYKAISTTRFSITATIVNPVQSVSGDADAAFGLVVDYQDVDALDFKQTVFATNVHFRDVTPPFTQPSGAAGIRADGVNGVAADFYAFLPTAFLQSIGLTDPMDCKGYVDGIETPPGDFTNSGLDGESRGFDFMSLTSDNQVLQVKVVNDDWSAHDVQFGLIQGGDPNAALKEKIRAQIKKLEKKLKRANRAGKRALVKKLKKKIKKLKRKLL